MNWPDWPITERDADSPINQLFMEKWRDRMYAHREREQTRVPYDLGVNRTISPPDQWNNIGGTNRIYVPPWAKDMYLSCNVSFLVTVESENGPTFPWTGNEIGVVQWRLRFDTTTSTIGTYTVAGLGQVPLQGADQSLGVALGSWWNSYVVIRPEDSQLGGVHGVILELNISSLVALCYIENDSHRAFDLQGGPDKPTKIPWRWKLSV